MRFIKKGGEPFDFANWKKAMRDSPQNLLYDSLSSEQKETLKEGLLKEQGYLCAYTMRRLDAVGNCHIEHLIPQNQDASKDLDYGNMLACFPKDGGDTKHGYGAPIKGGKRVVLNENFVSPLTPACEQHFLYTKDGSVSATDEVAKQTVQMLKLDHPNLTELRKQAAETHGLTLAVRSMRTKRKLKSVADARRFANAVLQPDANGKLEPFCVALAQIALEYAKKEEQRRNHYGDAG